MAKTIEYKLPQTDKRLRRCAVRFLKKTELNEKKTKTGEKTKFLLNPPS